jgi:hypothetical protein
MDWYDEYELYSLLSCQRFLRVVCLSRGGMEEETALQQWKACLPIRTAFHPLHFIDEALNHPVAPRQAASVGNSLCIIG